MGVNGPDQGTLSTIIGQSSENPLPHPAGHGQVGKGHHFNAIHMLRGIAALWVVLFHIDTFNVSSTLNLAEPLSLLLFDYGRGGVAVFFVLSGFVIAHSLANRTMNPREFGLFVARRSLRLDPPYFLAIALALSVSALIAFKRDQPLTLAGPGDILAHMVYLQELLHVRPISVVFWTLAYEFQFYLFFALLQMVRLHLQRHPALGRLVWLIDLSALGLAVAGAILGPGWVPQGLFLNLWYAFYLGVCVQRAVVDGRSIVPALLLAALMLTFAGQTADIFNSPAAFTGLGLLVLGKMGRLSFAHAPRPMMWLGTISYSLYLTHYQILLLSLIPAGVFVSWGAPSLAVGFQLLACLIAAQMFWLVIERPSQRWSKRFGTRRAVASRDETSVSIDITALGRGI